MLWRQFQVLDWADLDLHLGTLFLIFAILLHSTSNSAVMAPRGEADSYYNSGGPPNQYQMQQPYEQAPYQQPPPNYGQNYQNTAPPQPSGGKQTFDQAFKLEKPKYNDLWAGILVRSIAQLEYHMLILLRIL